jgi:hypothetical protein
MKNNQIATLVTALSIAVLAMTPALATASTQTKHAAAGKSKVKAKAKSKSKSNVKSTAAVAAVAVALTPEALAVAERVRVGRFPCEYGTSVTLSADPKTPGYFNMQAKNVSYHMAPVASVTGAVRLEEPKSGAVWLQLANKSMLMNQKQGTRLADECMSPEQSDVAQGMKNTPAGE